MPTEKVPVLEIDNQMFLVQSMAIARYVAKQASNLIIIFSRLVFFSIFFQVDHLRLVWSKFPPNGSGRRCSGHSC